MPTIFIKNGYRVSFYSYDLAERMNVKSGWTIWRWRSIADSSRMKSLKLENDFRTPRGNRPTMA
jgi:hypothetical protein